MVETEKQVIRHLQGHLERIPEHDRKSRTILEQMKVDEARHGEAAKKAGGADLPEPVRRLMQLTSRIMTGTAYRI